MKKLLKNTLACIAVALAAVSCFKVDDEMPSYLLEKEFQSWVMVHYPDAYEKGATTLGSYVLEREEGAGVPIGDVEKYPFILASSTTINLLTGEVMNTSDVVLAQQVGAYVPYDFFGPYPWLRAYDNLSAGIDELVSPLRVGGRVKAVVPGWLLTPAKRYDTVQKYIDNEKKNMHTIYEITVHDVIEDIVEWEVDSLDSYAVRNFPEFIHDPFDPQADTSMFGCYVFKDPSREQPDTVEMPNDTTVYIRYIGRLLNGNVFDTNVADTAKRYGLYKATSEYKAMEISWKKDQPENIKAVSSDGSQSDLISGFQWALSKMKKDEALSTMFISQLGYSISGSGTSIPPYAPLRFDIEFVPKPEN